ncbi:MAG: hypothetical protein KGJ74_10960 [Betaproteobacteria bacterium]|jgi:predicted flap endonuclease-1-like 5' DNA nuclease|nr:hypothetical protein [Thiomonas sp.]MDE2130176.1 hypothetical protein [Betaproteobacteria bacterium]OZB58029.1 MAG: hypothetical protein B7X31_14010 [Thiomonas sp. 13-66-29]
MTSIKDKLASSVRQAKSATPSKAAAAKPAAPRPAAKGAKQTSTQPAPARQAAAPARIQGTGANLEPASSAQALFPDRVWPD